MRMPKSSESLGEPRFDFRAMWMRDAHREPVLGQWTNMPLAKISLAHRVRISLLAP